MPCTTLALPPLALLLLLLALLLFYACVQGLGRRAPDAAEGVDAELIWQLCGVEAGSRIEGLSVRCVDEVGRPAAGGVRGRMQVSWAKGGRRVVLGGEDVRLPPLQAPDAVGAPHPFWVRFIGDPKEWPGELGCTLKRLAACHVHSDVADMRLQTLAISTCCLVSMACC